MYGKQNFIEKINFREGKLSKLFNYFNAIKLNAYLQEFLN